MSRLGRYWSLWRFLPAAERRARAGRVLDRLLRRDTRVRSLRLARGHLAWRSLERALSKPLGDLVQDLRNEDVPCRGPLFHALEPRTAEVAERQAEHARAILAQSQPLLERVFDLLGTGPRRPVKADGRIDWHRDFMTGQAWDPATYYVDVPPVRGDGSDVKRPWELSRFQHLLVLGQAYHLAPLFLSESEASALSNRCAEEAAAQVSAWIEDNPPSLGVNWSCTMEVALRAVSWVAALGFFRRSAAWNDAFLRELVRSLWVHGLHIRRNLEISEEGLATNHLLSDLLGLWAIARALPELRAAREWEDLSRSSLVEEIDRQVGEDGASFERSLPYHRFATEIFLHASLLAEADEHPMPTGYLTRLAGMLEFTAHCTRPDGTVPQWGDNDDGRVCPLHGYASPSPHDHRHLLALGGTHLGRPDIAALGSGRDVEALWLLGASAALSRLAPTAISSRGFTTVGYYISCRDDLHLGVPCGPVGTRGLGSHAHNDLFTLCLWASGREWITDPGTGVYSSDPALRNHLRSTAAHATLQLGCREQNEIGNSSDDLFRLTERAHPEVQVWRTGADGSFLSARHRGFSGPDGVWIHRREVQFAPDRRMILVGDRLGPGEKGDAEALEATPDDAPVWLRFPLAPGVSALPRLSETDWPENLRAGLLESAETSESSRGDRMRKAFELVDAERHRLWIAFDLPAGSSVSLERGKHSPRYGVIVQCPIVEACMPRPRTRDGVVRALTVILSPCPKAGSG